LILLASCISEEEVSVFWQENTLNSFEKGSVTQIRITEESEVE
jgi:hypothetical protein